MDASQFVLPATVMINVMVLYVYETRMMYQEKSKYENASQSQIKTESLFLHTVH